MLNNKWIKQNGYYNPKDGLFVAMPATQIQQPIKLCRSVALRTDENIIDMKPVFLVYLLTDFKEQSIKHKMNIYYTLQMILNNTDDFTLTEDFKHKSEYFKNNKVKGFKTRKKLILSIPKDSILTQQQSNNVLKAFARHGMIGYQKCSKENHLDDTVGRRERRSIDFFNLQQQQNSGRQHRSSCTTNNRAPVRVKNSHSTHVTINKFNYIRLNTAQLFVDAEDDVTDLRVDMKWANGREISTTDWIQYNVMLQLIYTWATYDIFVKQPKTGYVFEIKATDSCGSSTTMLYFVTVKSDVSPPCYAFALLVNSSLIEATPHTHIVGDLANILSKHLSDQHFSHHLVQSLEQQNKDNPKLFTLYFSDTRIRCDPCDRNQILTTTSTIQNNQEFHASFNPNFKYLGFTIQWDSCKYNSPPITLQRSKPVLNIGKHGSVEYRIPSDMFYDAEEMFTINLELSIQSASHEVVFILKDMNLLIYQVNDKPNTQSTEFTIQAKDKTGQKASLLLQIFLNVNIPQPPGYFTITMTTYYVYSSSDGMILSRILDTISEYTKQAKIYSQYVIISFKRTRIFPQQITLSFAKTVFYHYTIGYNAFLDMKNKLFFRGEISNLFSAYTLQYMRDISGHSYDNYNTYSAIQPTEVQPTMMETKMNPLPSITIKDISPSSVIPTTTTTTKAPNIPGPIARYQIGPFNVTFCDFLVFPIQDDLFIDRYDGTTSKLKLSMTTTDGKPVAKNSWIFVDSDIQVIYGYLKVDDYVKMGGVKATDFNLVATNSKGGSTALRFKVRLPDKIPDILYTVTMTMTPFYQFSFPEINEQLMILTKISAYFGRPSRFSWINIVSFTRSQNENKITIAWTSCTLEGMHMFNTVQYF